MSITPVRSILLGIVFIGFIWLLFGFFGVQALFIDKPVHESIPIVSDAPSSTDPIVPESVVRLSLEGDFVQGDSTYTIQGKAQIITQGDSRMLALTDFDVTNGPDLYVYFIAASSTENSHVKQQVAQKQFFRLATLKGNIGNQTYILPDDLDLSHYPLVSIWCQRFSRNFGSALLREN